MDNENDHQDNDPLDFIFDENMDFDLDPNEATDHDDDDLDGNDELQ